MKNKSNKHNIYNLYDRFTAGDNEAFSEIYDLFVEDMYALGLWFGIEKETIEDAIQDIFLNIYNKREKLHDITNLEAYLITSFRNRLFHLSKKDKHILIYEDITSDLTQPDQLEVIIEQENIQEVNNRVKHYLSLLNDNQREIVYYRFVLGKSYDEIAYIMNINYQSAKNLLHRALKKLRSAGIHIS